MVREATARTEDALASEVVDDESDRLLDALADLSSSFVAKFATGELMY